MVERKVEEMMTCDDVRAIDPLERKLPVPVRGYRVFVQGPRLPLGSHFLSQERGQPTAGIAQDAGKGSIPRLQGRPRPLPFPVDRGVVEIDPPGANEIVPSGSGAWHRSIQRRNVGAVRNKVRSSSDPSSAYPRETPPVSMTASIPGYLFVHCRVNAFARAK